MMDEKTKARWEQIEADRLREREAMRGMSNWELVEHLLRKGVRLASR